LALALGQNPLQRPQRAAPEKAIPRSSLVHFLSRWCIFFSKMNLIPHPHDKPHSEEDRRLNTLGFAIYDIIHIFCSISFLILILYENANVALDSGAVQANILLEMADEFTELILSFTLIFFVVFIYKAKTATNARSLYSFAWLLVSLSLVIPSTFELPFLYWFSKASDYGIRSLHHAQHRHVPPDGGLSHLPRLPRPHQQRKALADRP
jgi:hypothetical protein